MKLDLKLSGLQTTEEAPKLALYLIDSSGEIKSKLNAIEGGKLDVSPDLQKRERGVVALGPDVEDISQLRADSLLQLRLADQLPAWEKNKFIEVPSLWWKRWIPFRTCVSGQVRKCFPIVLDVATVKARARAVFPHQPFPRFCLPVCNGIVEVWERTCCCRPPLIIDIPSIIARLRQLIDSEPIKFPPHGPGPDPGPIDRAVAQNIDRALAMGAAEQLDFEPNTQLPVDLLNLQTLPTDKALEYFEKTPSLWRFWCHCTAHKVGETVLSPNGTFNFCFSQFPVFLIFCRRSYFYKVKQWQGGGWVYIYDGSAANQYFNASDFASLSTFRGLTCGQVPPPDGTDFATLQAIGGTPSYQLTSHYGGENAGIDLTQTGAFSVLAPPSNGGLVGSDDAPWAKTLSFLLFFHPDLKNIGAKFYRLSVVAADSTGAPAGGASPEVILNPVAWQKFVFVGSNWQVEAAALGPNTKVTGGNTIIGLFEIPYNADALWLGGQYHQWLDTTRYADGRYLLILELFDSNGDRLVPQGVPLSGTDKAAAFSFLRLLTANGPGSTARVPFAALTHLFWFDNRPCYGNIEDLEQDGAASTSQCQFLRGNANSLFQVGFRAFHATIAMPPPRTFMSGYSLTWHKGLNGPSGILETGGDVNQPSTLLAGANAKTPAQTFAQLLGTSTACSFAVNLDVICKHTNGSGHIYEYDVHQEAAFALSIEP